MAATFALALLLSVRIAEGNHTEPAKAKKVQFGLVNGFFECDPLSYNTSTSGGIPACAESVGSLCGFGPCGSGKVTMAGTGSASAGTQDVKIVVSAKGLNANCENLQLCLQLSYRATGDDCPQGTCTTTDTNDFSTAACCNVQGGVCKITTTALTAFLNSFVKNADTGFQILGCSVGTFSLLAQDALARGLLFPLEAILSAV